MHRTTITLFFAISLLQYYYANCFVVPIQRLQQLQFTTTLRGSSSLQLKLDNIQQDEQQIIETDTTTKLDSAVSAVAVAPSDDNFCMLEDIEVGCIDPLLDMEVPNDMSPETLSLTLSYIQFAKAYPNINNIGIATLKTASADLLAQAVFAHVPLSEIDWERTLAFGIFGAMYSGVFQYWYQVNIFKKLFDNVDEFTSQSWQDKLNDTDGLKSLAAQTALDLTVLTLVYLPTFYIFKAGVFSGGSSNTFDPSLWFTTGLDNYSNNFSKDELDLIRVWFPADLICFSVALYLRLPVRHIVSFGWFAYLSFARGGH